LVIYQESRYALIICFISSYVIYQFLTEVSVNTSLLKYGAA